MIFSLISAALVLLIAYMWSIKGFFSSFLHMLCVVVAGAIAFGLWEPVSLWLLNAAPQKGMLASLSGNAWALGLALPFAISLLLMRIAMDKLIRANMHQSTLVNYIGGGVCGLGSGLITVGILVISFNSVRLSDSTLGMGYKPVNYTTERATGGGSLVYRPSLLIPADKLTAKLYSHLSLAAFSAPEPLAKWHPDPVIEGSASRISYTNAKNTAKPNEVTFKGMYWIGPEEGAPAAQILSDAFVATPQKYVDLNGETVSQGRLLGVKFELAPNAKESTGQHMIAPGQLRLLLEPVDASGAPTGEPSEVAFPVALVSQADGSDTNSFGRWRFESEGVFVSSVGGGSTAIMSAEFVVPTGYRPLALYVKGVRLRLDNQGTDVPRFATTAMRDAQIRSGSLLETIKIEDLDRSKAFKVDGLGGRGGASDIGSISNQLGREAFQTSQKREMTISEKNEIVSGHGTWSPGEVSRSRDISNELKVNRFAVPTGTTMVQIQVGPKSPASLLGVVGAESSPNDPFYIIDTKGTPYQAVGYIYKDRDRYDIHFFPGDPLGGTIDLKDVPGLATVRDDQEMTLLFLVSTGVEMDGFAIGNKMVFEMEKPVLIESK